VSATVPNSTGALPTGAATAANQALEIADLSALLLGFQNDSFNINSLTLTSTGSALQYGNGATTNGTQRITISNDSTGQIAIASAAAQSNASSGVATGNALPTINYVYGWNGATWDQLGATSGTLNVGGNIASGSADSGNPVKVGGRYNVTQPTLSDGQRGDIQLGTRGSTRIEIFGAGGNVGVVAGTPGDAVPNNVFSLATVNYPELYNGATYDRARANIDTAALITLTTSSAASTTSANQTNYNGRGVKLVLNVTAIATGSVVLTLQGVDAASGASYAIAASGAISATGTYVLAVYPGASVADTQANSVSASQVVPRTWNGKVAGTVTGLTCTLGGSVVL
jgi:hypothetical protein